MILILMIVLRRCTGMRGDYLVVQSTFRGKNAFGRVVINWVKAQVDLDENVLTIIEQDP